ncbi:MAG: acyltransferase family protein [Amaricoccus sp.]|uniref:acyltransferase family protein n=1 Tax=Amaricoccus sp. TaxID=1872485 RepID=UPI0039E4F750
MTALADPARVLLPARRAADLDIARALGITLVVAGHALIGVERALGETPAGRFALVLIYAVHMPLFFFLSGLLARTALTEPPAAFARRLATRFAWPYLLWSLILLGFHAGFSDLTNTRVALANPLRVLWAPPSVMWFLYVLAAALATARLLRPLPAAATRGIGAALVVAGSLLDAWLLPYLRFAGLFLIATTLEAETVRRQATRPAIQVAAAALLASGAVFAALAAAAPLTGYPAAELRYLPAAAGGILLVLAAGDALARTALGPPLAALGRRTLPIFLTHILVLAALRIVLVHAGVTDRGLLLALVIPAGLLLPLAAAAAAERLRLSRLLGWS